MTTQTTIDQPKSTGAPRRNTNALKNGSRSYRLIIGDMPKGMHRQQGNALRYRRELENHVREQRGEITLTDAHWIDLATQCEIHAAMCRQQLKLKLETMPTSDVITCSKEIVKAKETRNRAFDRLKLDQSARSVLDALYSSEVDSDIASFAADEPIDDQPTESSSGDGDAAGASTGVEP